MMTMNQAVVESVDSALLSAGTGTADEPTASVYTLRMCTGKWQHYDKNCQLIDYSTY